MSIKLSDKSPVVPIIVTIIAGFAFVIIPIRILGMGYLPGDDGLSHAAKVVSGKDWSEILLLREEITSDSHPGWHAILGAVHRATGWETKPLVMFEVAFVVILFFVVPLFLFPRPEAWLSVLVLAHFIEYKFFARLFTGRPLVFTMVALTVVCFTWQKLKTKHLDVKSLFVLVTFLVLAAWIHGAWHLFFIPAACLFLAREWRAGWIFLGCIATQVVIASFLAGSPLQYVYHTLYRTYIALTSLSLSRMMVVELRGYYAPFAVVTTVAGMLMWRKIRGKWRPDVINNPVFILAAVGFVAGFSSVRFWIDWGAPALLCWFAVEIKDVLDEHIDFNSWGRVVFTAVGAAVMVIVMTSDIDARWTKSLNRSYVSEDDPKLAGWMPEPGGIVYNGDMRVFFQTFYKNPRARWRYMLGIEPAMMPVDILEIFQEYRFHDGNPFYFRPFVKRMNSADRMILLHTWNRAPDIPGLEWRYAAAGTWIGRLPQESAPIR